MNYQIIKNKNILLNFISNLPILQENEVWYIALVARKKYCNEVERIKSDKFQLKRFTSKTEHLLDKIEKLEVRKGLYKIGENEVPENSLALYISLNPCSIKKATISLTKSLIDIITSGDYTNLEQLALSSIHKSKSRVIFVDADIDTPDIFYNKVEFHNNYVKNKLPIDCYNVLKTKGGYHIHVNVNKVSTNLDFAKLWYKNLSSIKASDMISSDMLFPIPGCTQGNFVPYFLG